MDTAIVPHDHDRVTTPVRERSILGYIWGTLGGSLLLTMAMTGFVAWTLVVPAKAADDRVIKAPGKGFYDSASLSGAAANDIRSYMEKTWVECDDGQGHGRCNLNASTDSVAVRYVDDYAVMFLAYEADTGNRPATRLGLWKDKGAGGYDMVAFTDEMPLIGDISVTNDNEILKLSGIVQGPNDTFCCPTKKAAFALSNEGGKLSFSEVTVTPKVANVKRKRPNYALAALTGFASTNMSFAKPKPRSPISGFDFTHDNYAGEAPFQYFHNGSEMMVFPDHGIIAYKNPKPEISGVVHETDILFSGTINKTSIVGTAYVFKKGCVPLPYRVSGPGYVEIYKDIPPTIVLKGFAPVRARHTCEVVGTTAIGANSVLEFEPSPGYLEDAVEAETHSGYGYYDPAAK